MTGRNASVGNALGAPQGKTVTRQSVGGICPQTTIGANCVVRGNFEMQGKAQIDGTVEGEVVIEGELTVGEAGTVTANIFGNSVIIYGRVIGDVKCEERLELHSGAHLTGNVLSPRVIMHDGVVFEGRCWMTESAFQQEMGFQVENGTDKA